MKRTAKYRFRYIVVGPNLVLCEKRFSLPIRRVVDTNRKLRGHCGPVAVSHGRPGIECMALGLAPYRLLMFSPAGLPTQEPSEPLQADLTWREFEMQAIGPSSRIHERCDEKR